MDQFEIFLRYAEIPRRWRIIVLELIDKRQVEKVGVYLVDAQNKRILEVSVEVDWHAHAEFTAINPTIRTDLPGWESGGAPEIRTLGHRFGEKVREYGTVPSHWVLFSDWIRRDVSHHRRLCASTGYLFEGRVPEWRNAPVRRDAMPLLDLGEVNVSIAEA